MYRCDAGMFYLICWALRSPLNVGGYKQYPLQPRIYINKWNEVIAKLILSLPLICFHANESFKTLLCSSYTPFSNIF